MRFFFIFLFLLINLLSLFGQDCTILSKANTITPDKLCSPVSVNWQVRYNGVNNAGTPVQIQYNWDDGNSQIIAAVNTGPGIFQASATHTYNSTGNKCNYAPKATLMVNGVICSSSAQQQIVTVWDDDDHNGGEMHIQPVVYPTMAGIGDHIIRYEITDGNGCADVDTMTVHVRPAPIVNINPVPVLFINDPPVVLIATPPGGSFTGSGLNINSFYPDSAGIGIHVISYNTLPDKYGCTGKDTIHIKVLMTPPDATIIPIDTLCVQNIPVTLIAQDPGGTWSGNGVINDKFDPALAGAGNHIVSYNITDINGYSDFDQITITVMPAPVVNINPVSALFINDPPVVLIAIPPAGTFTGNGLTINSFYPDSAAVGIHIITYQTLTDRFGCIGTDTIHIKVIMPSAPIADFGPDSIGCSPLTVQFINKSVSGESYLWDFGDKTFSSEQNPSHTYFIPGNYIVKLTVTNIAGQSTHAGVISVYQNPTALFSVYPTEVINNSQVVVFSNHSFFGVSYLWSFGDGNISVEENPWHKYESDGIYNVTLTVTSKDVCIDSLKYKSPVVVEFKPGEIKFPNAFKWNETGTTGGYWNETQLDDNTFRPFFINVLRYKLQIFNRWGVLIYESHDVHKGWDGYFGNGNLALQGVYVWKVTGQFADGLYFDRVGDVTFLH